MNVRVDTIELGFRLGAEDGAPGVLPPPSLSFASPFQLVSAKSWS